MNKNSLHALNPMPKWIGHRPLKFVAYKEHFFLDASLQMIVVSGIQGLGVGVCGKQATSNGRPGVYRNVGWRLAVVRRLQRPRLLRGRSFCRLGPHASERQRGCEMLASRLRDASKRACRISDRHERVALTRRLHLSTSASAVGLGQLRNWVSGPMIRPKR